MASDLISRSTMLEDLRESVNWLHKIYVDLKYEDEKRICSAEIASFTEVIMRLKDAPAVDAIPIDDVAEMLAELFGEECCCDYNGIDEWLPYLCEHSDICPDSIGKNGCWKQFIKHWKERKKDAVD